MAQIYDNLNQKFIDGLRGIIGNLGVTRADFCVGYFNLRGWKCVSDLIEELPGEYVTETIKDEEENSYRYCRLLIGMQRADDELIQVLYSSPENLKMDSEKVQRAKRSIVENFRRQLVTGIPTADDEKALRELHHQLDMKKVVVKLYLKTQLHAKLYLAHRPEDKFNPIQALMGSSNLTFSGLKGQGELDAEIADSTNAKILSDWFEDKWNDRYCIDISEELLQVLQESWACKDVNPYYIYIKTAYHLSQEARASISEYNLPDVFQRQLFNFQQTAVKIAARHLEKRGGAMIGDVVGLGKTITACAVAKLYEMQHACSTLILCPANLVDMWNGYVKKYDLKADVKSVSKPLDVKNMRFYRLVIIDESHNLRNANGKRYKNIKELIGYQGCKVLLLTATPYNKEYGDLSNQLKLFINEDDDLGIMPEALIKKLGGQDEFSVKYSEDFIRSINAFEHSAESDDWQNLMRMFLVRRTRTFIKNSYAHTDKESGRKYMEFPDGTKSYFPERQAKSVKFKVSENDQFAKLYSEEMLEKLGSLKLPRYSLVKYIDGKKAEKAGEKEKEIIANLTKAGNTLMGFCRTMFMKRLDSSGASFLISIYRHILRNAIYLYALENGLKVPIGDDGNLPDDYTEEQDDSNLFEISDGRAEKQNARISFPLDLESYIKTAASYYPSIKPNVSWLPAEYFAKNFKTALKKDCAVLLEMLSLCGIWEAENDRKLDSLQNLMEKTHKGEKVLVFTQFSDTAHYIAEQLKNRGIEKIACVTGDTENATSLVSRFSPQSNGKENEIKSEDELDVLVATDVLSEGQNLQDSHVVVNYDLPWAIIRLIQRAGRVDRIGQKSDKIQCYSFFPAEGIDKIIKLRARLNERINENARVVGSDEIFFEGNEKNITDLYNEKNGILDDEDDGDVDLASHAYQIWLDAIKDNENLEKIIPSLSNVVYSSKANNGSASDEGVITYARTKDGNDMLTWLRRDGTIVTQSQKLILDSLACEPSERRTENLPEHHKLVATSIKLIKDASFKTSGILGSRFSTKYQLYTRLHNYWKENEGTLLIPENLKGAIDDIYNYTLKEKAKDTLSMLLRRGAGLETIIDLVSEYKDNDELVIKKDDELSMKTASIICSMGLVNNQGE